MTVVAGDAVAITLQQLTARRKLRFVLFRLEGDQVLADTSAPRSASFSDLASVLPASDCRYAVYDHEYASAPPSLFFVTWIPSSASSETKMQYARAKAAVHGLCGTSTVVVDAACVQQLARGVDASEGDGDDASVVELSSPVCFMSSMAF